MKKEKTASKAIHIASKEINASHSEIPREEKIINSMANTNIILASTMMDSLTETIARLTRLTASGMAEAVGGNETEDKAKRSNKGLAIADLKLTDLSSEIRKDIYAQFRRDGANRKGLLSDPVFDLGPRIIEEYDFKLPKLTDQLDGDILARYKVLLVKKDAKFVQMFDKLSSWLNSLPKIPNSKRKKAGPRPG